jgi:hypothetical protein
VKALLVGIIAVTLATLVGAVTILIPAALMVGIYKLISGRR